MADARKTDNERADALGLGPAEADLRWYFGDCESSRRGDAGVRSSLGSQLARAAGLSKRRRRLVDGEIDEAEAVAMGGGGGATTPQGYIDGNAAERHMAKNVAWIARSNLIESALVRVHEQDENACHILDRAFGHRELRPTVSAVVVVTAEARRATAAALGRVPTTGDVEQFVLEAGVQEAWLKRAKAAAEIARLAAVAMFATERFLVSVAPKSGKRQLLPEFWRWKDTLR